MKRYLLFFSPVLLGSLALFFNKNDEMTPIAIPTSSTIDASLGCAPNAEASPGNSADARDIVLLPGWGDHSYEISTSVDSTQVFFNQGLSLYYSYHSREAVASFKQAARFDSTSAMAYWGQALALGPSYNFGYMYKLPTTLKDIIPLMNKLSVSASPREKDLITAMNIRYDINDPADSERKKLNTSYADALKKLVDKYPGDVDIKALYIDAVMLIHPWSFWNNDGTAKPWTNEVVQFCEDVLKSNPRHPAGLHYYIHLTEASRKPEVALASADSLWKLFPGVAHMVHMSSHEYERIGYYAKGVRANEDADRSLVLYHSLVKGTSPNIHVPHYFAVEAYCALSGAMYKKGIPKTFTCRNSMEPNAESARAQYQYMFPPLAYVRMGKWDDILNDTTQIPQDWLFAAIIDDFAKGMAYAKTGKLTQAEVFLKHLNSKMKHKDLKIPMAPFASSPYEVSVVVSNILSSNILYQQKKYDLAITIMKKAIAAEDQLLYTEPKAWILPARQYLGAMLLKLNRVTEAEVVYREDLAWNPGNGWSLLGLYQSLKLQNKNDELANLQGRYEHSFSEADELPPASAY